MPTKVDDDGDDDRRQQQRQQDVAAEPVALDQPRRIGADAEPGAVAERDQPGIADAEVEPHRGDGERHHHGSGVERQAQADSRPNGSTMTASAASSSGRYFGRRGACHSNFSIRSPSSPRGRTSSTRNIST